MKRGDCKQHDQKPGSCAHLSCICQKNYPAKFLKGLLTAAHQIELLRNRPFLRHCEKFRVVCVEPEAQENASEQSIDPVAHCTGDIQRPQFPGHIMPPVCPVLNAVFKAISGSNQKNGQYEEIEKIPAEGTGMRIYNEENGDSPYNIDGGIPALRGV